MEEIFTRIWCRGSWGRDPRSGRGSTLEYTAALRAELPRLLERWAIKSMFDCPCGDYTWMQHVILPDEIVYEGGDVVGALVDKLRRDHPDISFRQHDITVDPFPDVDLWFCRDCLFHLSYADINRALDNFRRSNVRYVLTTSHDGTGLTGPNSDIQTGKFRPIYLRSLPFGFPKPIDSISDWIEGSMPRHLCLWKRRDLVGH